MPAQYYRAKNERFFKLAKLILDGKKPPTPFRRVLSLMRILPKPCETIVHEKIIKKKGLSCSGCDYREISCDKYIDNLRWYKFDLVEKHCHRFLFFQSEIRNNAELKRESEKDGPEETSLIGYCIVHHDVLIENTPGTHFDDQYYRIYLTECVLQKPLPRSLKGYAYGNYQTELEIDGVKFKFFGNYFSQQNAITNCCAQAAIKMGVRAYFPDITCELINDKAKISHEKQLGNKGFSPSQICEAIKGVSNGALEAIAINANDFGYSPDFLKTVYLSLESKTPVILLFNRRQKALDVSIQGHAITLIGHTFKTHHWGAYGGNYFSQDDIGYLSSFLWCSNFIVQDDNFGPFYHLPSRFFTDYLDFTRSRDAFEKYMMVKTSATFTPWHKDPLYAIFIYPKEMEYLKFGSSVEVTANAYIFSYVMGLAADNKLPSNSEDFQTYFYEYFATISGAENGSYDGSSIITRTVLSNKEEYLDYKIKEIYEENGFLDLVNWILPEQFWVTEVSVPELFWINKRKVGEVIIDPVIFENDFEKSIILIRLPGIFSFFENDEQWDYELNQKQPHHNLIKKKKGLARQKFLKKTE